MTKPTKAVQAIEDQLDHEMAKLLAERTPEVCALRREWAPILAVHKQLGGWDFNDLAKVPEGVFAPDERQRAHAVRTLGKVLHRIGGTALMLEVCERVSKRDPDNYSLRGSIMDKKFDGIGAADGDEWTA